MFAHVRALGLAVVLSGTVAVPALAEDAAPAAAAPAAAAPAADVVPTGGCLIAPAALSDQEVQDFVKDPSALIKNYPLGGPDLVRKVRGLAATDAKTIPLLFEDVKAGSDPTKSGIASGLGGAALACVRTRPDISLFIQQKVAGSGDKSFIDAFLVSTSNVATAATGAGARAAAGIGGSVGAALGGNGGAAGSGVTTFTTANTSGTFSFGGGGSVSDSNNSSVSP